MRKRYLDLFQKHGVGAIFAGHYHRNATLRIDDLEIIVTASLGKPTLGSPPGFHLVKVYAEHFETEFQEIGR